MDVVVLLFTVLFLISIRKSKNSFDLSKVTTQTIKEFCAVSVMLGHMSQIIGRIFNSNLLGNTTSGITSTNIFLPFRL